MQRLPIFSILMNCIFMLLAAETPAQSALDQAREAYKAGDYTRAWNIADVAVQQHASGESYMLRADCAHKLGEFSRALEDYDRARIAGYSNDEIFLNRGICKISMGLYEMARPDLMTYLQKHEDEAKAYYWMATLEYMAMENKACLRFLDQALVLDSAYADAYYLRAATYADQKKNNLALEEFHYALELNPAMHRAKMNMAILLLDMGQYRASIELLSELKLENIDFTSEVLYYRGEALYNLHDLEGACGDWVEAAEMGDNDAEANYRKLCLDRNDKPRFKRRTYFQF